MHEMCSENRLMSGVFFLKKISLLWPVTERKYLEIESNL